MPFVFAGGIGIWPFDLVVVCAMAGDVSDESVELEAFGIVMNLEPSLFVYFDETFELEDVEDCRGCNRWFAGIPIRGCRDEGT